MKTARIAWLAVLSLAALSPVLADPIQIAPQAATFGKNTAGESFDIRTAGTIQNHIDYTFERRRGTNDNNPLGFINAATLAAQGLENPFLQELALFGGGWTFGFNTTAVIADNTFRVRTYDVQGPTPPANNMDAFRAAAPKNDPADQCVKQNDCVGNEFHFDYVPTGNDPTQNVHWVQVIDTNYDSSGRFEVDNGGEPSPYYDLVGPASIAGFLDIPIKADPGRSYFFNAELFLVTGPAANNPGQMTIFGAIDWGWHNAIRPAAVPEPGTTWLLIAAALVSLGFFAPCRVSLGSRSNARRTSA